MFPESSFFTFRFSATAPHISYMYLCCRASPSLSTEEQITSLLVNYLVKKLCPWKYTRNEHPVVSVAGMCSGISGGQAARIQHSAVKCSWVRALQYKSAVLSAFSPLDCNSYKTSLCWRKIDRSTAFLQVERRQQQRVFRDVAPWKVWQTHRNQLLPAWGFHRGLINCQELFNSEMKKSLWTERPRRGCLPRFLKGLRWFRSNLLLCMLCLKVGWGPTEKDNLFLSPLL